MNGNVLVAKTSQGANALMKVLRSPQTTRHTGRTRKGDNLYICRLGTTSEQAEETVAKR